MTGMKEGAGEDPFADDSETTADADRDGATTDSTQDTETATNESTSRSDGDPVESAGSGRGDSGSMQIPYKYRRDGVQDGRSRVPLFLKPETKRAERDAQRELEERLDDDVSLTDLREALVRAGLEHLDHAEAELAEWGYGLTFEE